MDAAPKPGFEGLAAAAVDTLSIHLAVLDADGVIVATNDAWERFGAENDADPATTSVGVDYRSVCRASDDDWAGEAYDGLTALLDGDREQFELEYPCHSPDEQRWFLLQAARCTYQHEPYVAVAHVDVTERKLAEIDAQDTARTLERERERLAVLNQVVRHDIRNDAAVIGGWVEELRTVVPPERQALVDDLLDATEDIENLTRTVGRLVDAMDREDTSLESMSLDDVLSTECRKLRSCYDDDADVTVSVQYDEPTTDPVVLGDALLHSLFRNLLTNAVLHTDSPSPTVAISVSEDSETVSVRIADDGPGLPEGIRDDPFGEGTKGLESGGTGLGLYLVDQIVRRYGGSVRTVDSDLGGAGFEVTLPRT